MPRLGGRLSPTHVPKIKSDPQLRTPISQKETTHFSILFIPKLTSDLKISSNFALSDMVLISTSTASCSARCRLPGAPACANRSRQCLRQSFLGSNVSALQGQRRVCRSARLALSLVKVRSLTKKDTHIHPCYNTVSNSLHRDLGHTRVSTAVRVLLDFKIFVSQSEANTWDAGGVENGQQVARLPGLLQVSPLQCQRSPHP